MVCEALNRRAKAVAHSPFSHAIVLFGACGNTFVPLFSGPLTLLFCTIAASAPRQRFWIALINAVGAMVGMAALYYFIRTSGSSNWLAETFPRLAPSSEQEWLQEAVGSYGLLAIFGLCTLPVMIQPLALFAAATHVPLGAFALAVFGGRFIKYSVMAQLACYAPKYLALFGASAVTTQREHDGPEVQSACENDGPEKQPEPRKDAGSAAIDVPATVRQRSAGDTSS